jgi:hAT family C-terminal dimerisation region
MLHLPNYIQIKSLYKLSKKMKLLEKFRGVGQDVDLANKIGNEVNTYLHLEITNVDEIENPLVFWKHQQHNFPHLSVLAKAYLSVSASSVPVEAMFSTSGLILNQKRSSMAPFRANMASVIHDNYSKYYPISREQAGQFKS